MPAPFAQGSLPSGLLIFPSSVKTFGFDTFPQGKAALQKAYYGIILKFLEILSNIYCNSYKNGII
jgi:hypothetical protein